MSEDQIFRLATILGLVAVLSIQPAAGPHPGHYLFPEFDPKRALKPGESFELLLDRVGTIPFHDHDVPKLEGSLTIEGN